jgi:hypothetical protein
VVDDARLVDPRIYTRGAAATESADGRLGEEVVTAALGGDGAQATLVGDGWPAASDIRRRATLAGYLAEEPGARRAARRLAAVSLYPFFDASLGQVLLVASGWEETRVVTSAEAVRALGASTSAVRRVIESAVDIQVTNLAGRLRIVTTRRRQPQGGVEVALAEMTRRPHGKVANSWREALTAAGRDARVPVTKNAARRAIDEQGLPTGLLQLRLLDVSQRDLERVVQGVTTSMERVLEQAAST